MTIQKHHKFNFGAQADFSKTLNGFQPFGQSYYRFASFDDFKTGKKPTDFGLTYSLNPDFSQAFPSFKFQQLSAYAQDEISVSKNSFLKQAQKTKLQTEIKMELLTPLMIRYA
jgi:hypothetical protein